MLPVSGSCLHDAVADAARIGLVMPVLDVACGRLLRVCRWPRRSGSWPRCKARCDRARCIECQARLPPRRLPISGLAAQLRALPTTQRRHSGPRLRLATTHASGDRRAEPGKLRDHRNRPGPSSAPAGSAPSSEAHTRLALTIGPAARRYEARSLAELAHPSAARGFGLRTNVSSCEQRCP
jgi:hypothetical protein